MESAVAPGSPADSESAFGRLLGVFVSPAKTFAAIARRPTWLLPVAIWAGLALPLSELILSKTDWRAFMTKQMARGERKMTEAQLEAAIEQSRRLGWLWDVAAVLAPFLVTLVVAGVLWGACQAFGWDVKFKQSLGVTAHAFFPAVLGSIALLVVLWNRDTVDPELVGDALRTNLGFLVDRQTNPVLHGLLASLDLFSFWTLGLLVLGLSAAAGAPRGRVALLVVTLWGLFVLGKAGVTALF